MSSLPIWVFTSSAFPFHWVTVNLDEPGAHWKLASSESRSFVRERRDEHVDCCPGWEAFVEEKQPVPGSLPSQQPHESPTLNMWGSLPLPSGNRLREGAELLQRLTWTGVWGGVFSMWPGGTLLRKCEGVPLVLLSLTLRNTSEVPCGWSLSLQLSPPLCCSLVCLCVSAWVHAHLCYHILHCFKNASYCLSWGFQWHTCYSWVQECIRKWQNPRSI